MKSFSFKYVIGHAKLIGPSGGNLPQSSSCVEVEKAASVEEKRSWRIRHGGRLSSQVLSANAAGKINGE